MKRRIISAVIAGVMTLGVGGFAYTENQGQPEETERSVTVSEKRRAFVDRTENSDENEKGQRGSGEDKTFKCVEKTEETGEEVTDRRDKQGKEDRKSEKSSEGNRGKKTSDRENSSSSSSDSNRPASRPSGNSGNSSSGSSGKPNNTPSSKPNNKPSGESGQTENKPSKPSHTHNWSPQTTVVHHPATGHYEDVLVKDSWTESKPIYETVAIDVCNTCGADITDNPSKHIKQHMLAGEGGSWRTEYIQKQTGTETITHPAEYETRWVQDSAAWDETVTIGYTCSCGATK